MNWGDVGLGYLLGRSGNNDNYRDLTQEEKDEIDKELILKKLENKKLERLKRIAIENDKLQALKQKEEQIKELEVYSLNMSLKEKRWIKAINFLKSFCTSLGTIAFISGIVFFLLGDKIKAELMGAFMSIFLIGYFMTYILEKILKRFYKHIDYFTNSLTDEEKKRLIQKDVFF